MKGLFEVHPQDFECKQKKNTPRARARAHGVGFMKHVNEIHACMQMSRLIDIIKVVSRKSVEKCVCARACLRAQRTKPIISLTHLCGHYCRIYSIVHVVNDFTRERARTTRNSRSRSIFLPSFSPYFSRRRLALAKYRDT